MDRQKLYEEIARLLPKMKLDPNGRDHPDEILGRQFDRDPKEFMDAQIGEMISAEIGRRYRNGEHVPPYSPDNFFGDDEEEE